MSPPPSPQALREGDFIRDLRIVRRLERGSASLVFLVERGGRQYALRMSPRPLTREGHARVDAWLRREVAVLERLNHPAIPKVYEWGRWPEVGEGHAYFLTQHVRGRSWHAWRWAHRASLHRAVGVLALLARTLEILHARGLCYRALQSDNLLVDEEEEVPFLIDFGVAPVPLAHSLTEGLAPDSLYRQPPEVIAFVFAQALHPGERMPETPSADLYALGVLLYETLTHRRPFDSRGSLARLLLSIASLPPVDPRRIDPTIPEGLALLTLWLLEKNPEQRPPSARAVREELERLRAQAPDSGPWHAEPSLAPGGNTALAEALEVVPEAARASARAPGASGWGGWALGALALLLGAVGCWLWLASVPEAEAPSDAERFLALCPAEARATPGKLDLLAEEHVAFLRPDAGTPVTETPIARGGALNLKPGPVSADLFVVIRDREVAVTLFGLAKTSPQRVELLFDRLRLPDGREFPLCAVATEGGRAYGLATWNAEDDEGRALAVRPELIDPSPDSVVLAQPRFEVVVQGPEGLSPRRR
jgi:eukaryotic-like serine/threonine-protein kinase